MLFVNTKKGDVGKTRTRRSFVSLPQVRNVGSDELHNAKFRGGGNGTPGGNFSGHGSLYIHASCHRVWGFK